MIRLTFIALFISSNIMAVTVKPGHYLGTLEIGNKPTGEQCHVHVESEKANNDGEGCFDYIVSSKELGIKKLTYRMRYDVATSTATRCSTFVSPTYSTNKENSYIVDNEHGLNIFINRKTGFLRQQVHHCKNLVYVKDN